VGTSYWSGVLDWLRDVVADRGYINPEDLDLIELTDDVDRAVEIIVESRKKRNGESGVTPDVTPKNPQ